MPKRKRKIAAPRPSTEALRVADLLHSAAIHLLRRVRVRDSETGVGPAQLSALSVLVFGGPRSLGELAEAEHVRPPTMSRIVRGLERAKLVRRKRASDKRRVQLEATPKGARILWEGRRRRVALLANALARVSEGKLRKAAAAAHFLSDFVRSL